jgi:hypothetical protein
MPPALVKLVALLLLVVQGAVASASGRVLCIPLRDCGEHHDAVAAAWDHCGPDECSPAVGVGGSGGSEGVGGGCDHEHGPVDAALHPGVDCGCHVHVPVPATEQIPGDSKCRMQDVRAVYVRLVIAVVVAWDFDAVLAVRACSRPPDFSESDQVRGLKATRLIL